MSCKRSVMTCISSLMEIFCRRKRLDESSLQCSSLARILDVYDLTALGVGSTLGVGIYVLAGEVSKTVAGPAVVVSFFLAALTSMFAGLCYAEFGARVPKAGSAYIYSYYCVGELVAFFIGWNLILEYVIGAASVARGISMYIDSLLCNRIREFFLSFAPLSIPYMSQYVDLLAFGLCFALAIALAYGVKESTVINNFFTICNLSVVVFVIVSGLFKADFHNWNLDQSELPGPEAGDGGFAPFGVVGIIKGAAICFYGFVGFDCIATTGEEVKNPQRSIPVSILFSLLIIFLAYFGISSVLTLMVPYYLQDTDAPIPHAYDYVGWGAAKWLVSIGALFGLFSSLFGAMFPLPRIIYAMASDGLIFRFLGYVNSVTRTPVIGTIFAGIITASMAAFFNLQQLISLMALGTLLAYTIVAISVLILRYSPDMDDTAGADEHTGLVTDCGCRFDARSFFLNYFSFGLCEPNSLTRKTVIINIVLYSIMCVILSFVIMKVKDISGMTRTSALVEICIIGTIMLLIFLSICSQPKSRKCLPFQMPLVPLLPCISIFFNIYLMAVMDGCTWARFSIWMVIGIVPYLCWYFWKYRRGDLGANSPYNINRENVIKLNELVWKLLVDKKNFLSGHDNRGFLDDDVSNAMTATVTSATPSLTGQKDPAETVGADAVHCIEESHVTIDSLEIISTRISQKVEDVEPAVQTHTQFENNPAGNEDESVRTIGSNADSTGSQLTGDENDLQEERPRGNNEKDAIDKTASEVNIANDVKKGVIDYPSREGIRTVMEMESEFLANFRVRQRDTSRSEKVKSEISTIRRNDKLLNSEMKEKLSRILQEQASLIQSGLIKPISEGKMSVRQPQPRDSSHVDVKTLSKTEIVNKLQDLLKNGPPQRPSFRTAGDLRKS